MIRTAVLPSLLVFAACAAPPPSQEAARCLVRFDTDLGPFVVDLDEQAAPITCANFLHYVDAGRYDGGRFHRAVRLDNQSRDDVLIEVVQASARRDDGAADPAPIQLERTRDTGLRHVDGTISMARGSPDSARSDFFVCIGAQPSLDYGGARNTDGQGFAAFGRVVDGMNVMRAIQAAPTERERLTPPIAIRSATRLRGTAVAGPR